MGFCTPDQYEHFLEQAPRFEKLIGQEGIYFFKFWLDIGQEMQIKRFHDRRHDPLKVWKLSPMDIAALDKWGDYTEKRDRMLKETHTKHAPWIVAKANDKRRAHLNVIRHMLLSLDYEGRDIKAIGEIDKRSSQRRRIFSDGGGCPQGVFQADIQQIWRAAVSFRVSVEITILPPPSLAGKNAHSIKIDAIALTADIGVDQKLPRRVGSDAVRQGHSKQQVGLFRIGCETVTGAVAQTIKRATQRELNRFFTKGLHSQGNGRGSSSHLPQQVRRDFDGRRPIHVGTA